ncbi:MAG: hypothetical protein LBU24_03535 [Methanocalculaceae archaeon]|nr:hypothetical protein [Methanocalculaceae archaeon]
MKGVAGGDNIWSAEVNTINWQLDEYSITVEGTEVGTSTPAYFHVVEKIEH